MAGSDVIGPAVCIILLVIVCYTVVGSIMMTSGVITSSQYGMTQSQQALMETSISVAVSHYHFCDVLVGTDYYRTDFRVLNSGNQIIKDLSYIDIMQIQQDDGKPYLYMNGSGDLGSKTYLMFGINKTAADYPPAEDFNLRQWDPDEYLIGHAYVYSPPTYISVVLPNGVTAAKGNIRLDTLDDC